MFPDLLGQIPEDEPIGTVTADGAYDTRRCHTAILARQATPIIPIRKNGRLWKGNCSAARARNETLRATRYYGRAFWKRWTGSTPAAGSRRRDALPESLRWASSSPSLGGETWLTPDRQTAEIHIRIAGLMNRFSALGTAEIVRVASDLTPQETGHSKCRPSRSA